MSKIYKKNSLDFSKRPNIFIFLFIDFESLKFIHVGVPDLSNVPKLAIFLIPPFQKKVYDFSNTMDYSAL